MNVIKFEDVKVGSKMSVAGYGMGYCSRKDGDGTVEIIAATSGSSTSRLVHKIKFGRENVRRLSKRHLTLDEHTLANVVTYGSANMDPELLSEYKLLMKELEAKYS